MADFLDRLLQRTSGRVPVIKPLIRSSYGSSLQVHETVDEFEETVSFEEMGTPASPDATRTVRNNVLTSGGENTQSERPFARPENNNRPVKPAGAPSSRRSSGRESVRKFKKVTGEVKAVPAADKNKQDGKTLPDRKIANRQMSDSVAPSVPQKSINAAGNVIQRKSLSRVPSPGTIKAQQTGALDRAVRKETIIPLSRQNIVGRKDVSGDIIRTNQIISPQSGPKSVEQKSVEKAAGRRQIPAEAAPSVPRQNLLISDANVPRKPLSNIPGHETIVSRQPNVFAWNENKSKTMSESDTAAGDNESDKKMADRRITAPSMQTAKSRWDSSILGESVRSLTPDLVVSNREESGKLGLQGKQGEQQTTVENRVKYTPVITPVRMAERVSARDENPPSPDIHVTIGRVEIRAVQPLERKARRVSSAPRKPALSLDAYLKGRNEEKR